MVNVVIHFLSALLVWAIVRRTLRLPRFGGRFNASAGWLALAAATLWALHPLVTETVVYVTQRTELMVAFFYLATLYCSLRYWTVLPLLPEEGHQSILPLPLGEGRGEGALANHYYHRNRTTWLLLAVLGCLAGMASKEVMVSAPLMVLLFERTFVAGSLKTALRRSWPLYAGISVTWILLLVICLGAPHGDSAGFGLGVDAYAWWLTQAKVFWMYMKLAIWPSPLLIHYQLPYLTTLAEAWMYVVPLLIVGIIVLILLWRNRPIGFLGAWVFAILAPTFAVPIVLEMAAERRMYLPLVALVVPVVVGGYLVVQWLQKRWTSARSLFFGFNFARLASTSLVILLALTFGLVSAKRLAAYSDEMTLWREVLQHQPDNFMAHICLGSLFVNSGQVQAGVDELQQAVSLRPDAHLAFDDLGVAMMHLGRFPQAMGYFNHALQLKPDSADVYQHLGNALTHVGQYPQAIASLEHALTLRPDSAEAHDNLGVALGDSHQLPQAIEQFRQAIELNPGLATAHVNLATLLASTGDTDESISQYMQAIQLQPGRADLHNSLGVLLGKNERANEAIAEFQAALRVDPKSAQAYSNLALTYALTGRSEEAIATSQRGIEVARSTGHQEEAKMAEEWLTHYRAELEQTRKAAAAASSSPTAEKMQIQ